MDIILSLILLISPIDYAALHVENGDYEIAQKLLLLPCQKNLKYYYLDAIINHRLRNKNEAISSAKNITERFTEEFVPVRYIVMANIIKEDCETWKDEDLGDIGRRMNEVANRLELARGGKTTEEKQKKILELLDKQIKEKEQELEQQKQQAKADAEKRQEGRKANGQEPPPDTPQGTESGKGTVDPKKLMELAKGWGKLPPKDRSKAMMELTKDLPPRYREVIENYFKTLAKNGEKQ